MQSLGIIEPTKIQELSEQFKWRLSTIDLWSWYIEVINKYYYLQATYYSILRTRAKTQSDAPISHSLMLLNVIRKH